MKKSVLEESFERNFKSKLKRAGFKFETEKVLPGAKFRYDVRLTKGSLKILLEIDGHGFGHSGVKRKKRDAEKGNHAILSGYLFFRITTKHFLRGGVPANYAHDLVDRWIRMARKRNAW